MRGIYEDGSPWTVEEYLNNVTYNDNDTYIPGLFSLEFINFIKMVNGTEGEENKTPVVHLKMLDTIEEGERRIANLCHRGIAKTTVMGEYLFLYIAVYGKLPGLGKLDLAIYVSDSIDNGVKNMRKNLEYRWENSEFLREWIPEITFTDVRWEFKNKDGKLFIVKGYGAKSGVRGAKELGQRPQLAVLDDLVSDEDARSPTVISKIEDTIYKAVNYALHPRNKMIIWSGTPFNASDPLYKAVESGAWSVNVFPVCEEFPVARKDFKGSWEDRFTYDYVKEEYDNAIKLGMVNTFNQELMLRIMSEEDRLITDDDIRWYRRKNLLNSLNNYNIYITTDFATSAEQSADFSVISVWAYSNNGDWFWLDGMCKKQTMEKNIDVLFLMAQRYKPVSVGIEVTGQQGGFIPWIVDQMIVRNVFFTLASDGNNSKPGIRPNTNKMVRFNTVVPLFKTGKIYFPEDAKDHEAMVEAMNELALVSNAGFKSKHDDFADTISMLTLMNPWRPSVESATPKNSDNSGIWLVEEEDIASLGSNMNSYIV